MAYNKFQSIKGRDLLSPRDFHFVRAASLPLTSAVTPAAYSRFSGNPERTQVLTFTSELFLMFLINLGDKS